MAAASSPGEAGPSDGGSRSARKREAILEAATTVFLRNGYLRTSMDDVATLAAVSKQTVYKHFADKERLFTDIILGTIDRVGEPFYAEIESLQDSDDVETDLGDLARRLIGIVMQPQVLQLRRLVTAEADRFPELGRAYYERGPERTVTALASWFQRVTDRGLLRLEDPLTAAHHFNWLILSIPLNKVMLCGVNERFTAADLERFADSGVRAFLAGYGQPVTSRTKCSQQKPP